MLNFLATLLATLPAILRSRAAMELENLSLRHQIGVPALRRKVRQVDSAGPSLMGLAVPHLERLALGVDHRSAGDGDWTASATVRSARGLTTALETANDVVF